MKKFEYTLVEYEGRIESHRSVLDEYGRGGWELVAVLPTQGSTSVSLAVLYYLKRPKEE